MGWWLKLDGGLRILIGAVVAQLVGCLIATAGDYAWRPVPIATFFFAFSLSGLLLPLAIVVVINVRRCGLNRLWHYLVGGPLILLIWPLGASVAERDAGLALWAMLCVGLPMFMATGLFWAIAIRNNPAPDNLALMWKVLLGAVLAQWVGSIVSAIILNGMISDITEGVAVYLALMSVAYAYPLLVYACVVAGIVYALGFRKMWTYLLSVPFAALLPVFALNNPSIGGHDGGLGIPVHVQFAVVVVATLISSGIFWAIAIRPAGFPLSRE